MKFNRVNWNKRSFFVAEVPNIVNHTGQSGSKVGEVLVPWYLVQFVGVVADEDSNVTMELVFSEEESLYITNTMFDFEAQADRIFAERKLCTCPVPVSEPMPEVSETDYEDGPTA